MRLRVIGFAAIVAGSLAAPVSAQDWCAPLNRIAAAAREPAPFASLRNETEILPGYEERCRVDGEVALVCHRDLAPASLDAAAVGRVLVDCLGAQVVMPAESPRVDHYRTATLDFTVESHCDERCEAGRIASLRIERR